MLAMAVITVNTHSLWNNKAVCKSQQSKGPSGHLTSGAEGRKGYGNLLKDIFIFICLSVLSACMSM